MKKIVTILILVMSVTVFAQDTRIQTGGDEALEQRAIEITDAYNAELGLRAKQELLFRKKVTEFLIREEKIKATSSGRDMLNKMVALRQNEMAEMGDILTRIQLERYKKVRPRIQPLAVDEQ